MEPLYILGVPYVSLGHYTIFLSSTFLMPFYDHSLTKCATNIISRWCCCNFVQYRWHNSLLSSSCCFYLHLGPQERASGYLVRIIHTVDLISSLSKLKPKLIPDIETYICELSSIKFLNCSDICVKCGPVFMLLGS